MNTLRKQPAATRACRPKRSRNCSPAWIERVRSGRSGCRSKPLVGSLPEPPLKHAFVWPAQERITPAARRLAGLPPEALAEFPPAWGERGRDGRSGCRIALGRPRHRRNDCRHGAHRQLARTAAERALVLEATRPLRPSWRSRRARRSIPPLACEYTWTESQPVPDR